MVTAMAPPDRPAMAVAATASIVRMPPSAFQILQGAPFATVELRVRCSPHGFGLVLGNIRFGGQMDWNRVSKLVEGDGFAGSQGVAKFDKVVAVNGVGCVEQPAHELEELADSVFPRTQLHFFHRKPA